MTTQVILIDLWHETAATPQVVLRPDLLSHSAVSKALGTGRRWQELLRLQARCDIESIVNCREWRK